MAAFVIVATAKAPEIEKSIETHFEIAQRLKLSAVAWLVHYEGTTQSLAELLKIRGEPHVGSGVVFRINNYSGRAAADVWEWLSTNIKSRAD
jgi:hypothetical protein